MEVIFFRKDLLLLLRRDRRRETLNEKGVTVDVAAESHGLKKNRFLFFWTHTEHSYLLYNLGYREWQRFMVLVKTKILIGIS